MTGNLCTVMQRQRIFSSEQRALLGCVGAVLGTEHCARPDALADLLTKLRTDTTD